MTGLKRTPRSRGGFTLVELIVVLVILGVLAAFAVPALTGYIDSAHEKQAVSEAQACVETATRLAAARYAKSQQTNVNASVGNGRREDKVLGGWVTSDQTAPTVAGDVALTEGTGQYLLHVANAPGGGFPATEDTTVFTKAAGVDGIIQTLTLNASGQVVYLVYTSKTGIQVVYANEGTTASVDTGSDEVVVVPKPKATDEPSPTAKPTTSPEPTVQPTAKPTAEPTVKPTTEPTASPTPTLTPSIGSISVEMYDENGEPLSDCKMYLAVYNVNNRNTNDWTGTSKSFPIKDNKSWNITEDHVSTVMYPNILMQLEAPAGYQRISDVFFRVEDLGNGKHKFSDTSVGLGNVKFDDSEPTNIKIKVYCQPMQKLTIHKIDEHGNPLQGATFRITNTKGVNYTVTTDASGNAYVPMEVSCSPYTPTPNCIHSNDYDRFTVQEISSPYGYTGESKAVFWTNTDGYKITPHMDTPDDSQLVSYSENDETVTFKNRKQDVDTGDGESNSSFGNLTITGVTKWKHKLSTSSNNKNIIDFHSGEVYSYETATGGLDYYFMTTNWEDYDAGQYKGKPNSVPSPEGAPFNMLDGRLVKLTGSIYKKGDTIANLTAGDMIIWQQDHFCPLYTATEQDALIKHCNTKEHKDSIYVLVYTGKGIKNYNTASLAKRPSGDDWSRLNSPRCYFPAES